MNRKGIGFALVLITWLLAGVGLMIAASYTADYGYSVGETILAIFLSVGFWALGFWLYRRYKLGHSICWIVAVIMLIFVLVSIEESHPVEIILGLVAAVGFAVHGFIAFRNRDRTAQVNNTGHVPMPHNALPRSAHPHNAHGAHRPHTAHNPHAAHHASIDRHNVTRLWNLLHVTYDEYTRHEINYLYTASRQIVEFVEANPADAHKASLFLEFHLPKTVQLLERYTAISQKEIKGKNMQDAMEKISESLAQMKKIFEHCLDGLYSDIVHDINTDIEVMEHLINMEGLDTGD